MKVDFLFAVLNLNTIHEKTAKQMHVSMDNALNTRDIKYLNVESRW